jgi:hypothetical protein
MQIVEKILPASEYLLQIRIPSEIFFSQTLKKFPIPLVNYDVIEP